MGPVTPKIDTLLQANLQKAKLAQAAKPYFFALVLKGGTSGKLLVDRLKIKDDKIGAAKRATGGTAVVSGVCYFDRQLSKLVFETKKPPLPTWAQVVKVLAKNEAGLTIEAKFILAERDVDKIQEPEADKEDEKGEPAEESAEKKQGLEKWNERFEALKATLLAADKAGKPWAKDLWLKLSQAGVLYRQGKLDEAKTMYKEVVAAHQKFVSQPAGANGPQTATGSKPQPGSAPSKGPAATIGSRPAPLGTEENSWPVFDRRLSALMPAYRAAQGRPSGTQLETLFRTANRFRDNADLTQAMKVLAEMETVVKRAAAAPTAGTAAAKATAPPKAQAGPGTSSGPKPGSTGGEDGAKEEVKKRLKDLMPGITEASKGPNKAQVMPLYEKARELRDSGEYAKALKVLAELEPLLKQSVAAPPEATDVQYLKAKAKFAAARGTWIKISGSAVSTIHSIRDAIHAQYKDVPKLAKNVANAMAALDTVAAKFNDDLKHKFDEFIADPPPPPEARDKIKLEALDLIAAYRVEIESNSIYADLDEREFSQELVKAPLLQALAGMAKDLA